MKSPEKKQFKDIKNSELERINKKDTDKRIQRLEDEGCTYDEAALIIAKEDSKELIERVGTIDGEEGREKARKNKIKSK